MGKISIGTNIIYDDTQSTPEQPTGTGRISSYTTTTTSNGTHSSIYQRAYIKNTIWIKAVIFKANVTGTTTIKLMYVDGQNITDEVSMSTIRGQTYTFILPVPVKIVAGLELIIVASMSGSDTSYREQTLFNGTLWRSIGITYNGISTNLYNETYALGLEEFNG